jgi:peptidoglycan/LPS O-acetylase OafA/YrhL
MELITAVLLAGPLGYLGGTRRRGLVLYLLLWAIVFPVQSVVVHSENADDINPAYFVVNAVILALGVGLNSLGAMLRRRRAAKTATSAEPA